MDQRAGRTLGLVQVLGIVRKDLAEIVRQPRLVAVLVLGPFAVLFLFGLGYDQQSVLLRTVFVGPEGAFYETAIQSYGDEVDEYVEIVGYTSDVVLAGNQVSDGETDIAVVLPADPGEALLESRQAVITVIHDKLDPIQQTAVEVSAQVAVQELNALVLREIVADLQASLQPLEQSLDESGDLADRLVRNAEAGDADATSADTAELRNALTAVDRTVVVSDRLLGTLGSDDRSSAGAEVDRFRTTLDSLRSELDAVDSAESPAERRAAADRAETLVGDLRDQGARVSSIDPDVLVRPFRADTENLLRERIRINDFFAPSAIALLIQHLALTFAALSIVRDRNLGLLEIYRVAPVRSGRILVGKYLAMLLVAGLVATVLTASVALGVGVPVRGSLLWVAFGLGTVALAAIGLGLTISVVAGSDSQAVQLSMLVLLASMFFGGFFLSLDAFRFPIRVIAWVLPVTYGIRLLQDVMLRGEPASTADIVGLVSLSLVYGGAAWLLFSRRLSVR